MHARRLAVSAALALVAALPATPAGAAGAGVVVTAGSAYTPSEVVVPQGGTLTLLNADSIPHDVRARRTVGGVPLFSSPAIGFGQTADVAGVAALPASTYSFYCSVHEFMIGNLRVIAAA